MDENIAIWMMRIKRPVSRRETRITVSETGALCSPFDRPDVESMAYCMIRAMHTNAAQAKGHTRVHVSVKEDEANIALINATASGTMNSAAQSAL